MQSKGRKSIQKNCARCGSALNRTPTPSNPARPSWLKPLVRRYPFRLATGNSPARLALKPWSPPSPWSALAWDAIRWPLAWTPPRAAPLTPWSTPPRLAVQPSFWVRRMNRWRPSRPPTPTSPTRLISGAVRINAIPNTASASPASRPISSTSAKLPPV